MSKVQLDVEQVKKLLTVARQNGTIDSWIRLAVEWMEEASKQAIAMRDELKEYKRAKWTNEDIAKALTMRGNSESTNSSAEHSQDKVDPAEVKCELCNDTQRVYSHSPTSPTHGYPCPLCCEWYRGNR